MYAHLDPAAAEALLLPKPDRIQFCKADRWVGYTVAIRILKQLDDLFVHPKSLRMPNILVIGRSDNGKSSIIEKFIHRHPLIMGEDGTCGPCIIRVSMPPKPTESKFWSEVLWSMGIVHRERDAPDIKERQAIEVMHTVSVRTIAIDELNHLTNAGKEAAVLLAAINNTSSRLRVPIVAAGTQAAINALNSDPQMKSRFEPMVLERWRLDKEYLRFLATYETFLPLPEPSGLAGRELAPAIYGLAGDTIGGTVRVLKAAATAAIENDREKIDLKVLSSMNYTRPGEWDDVAKRA